ncbi:DEAD/DEAH box helicase [Actinoplanes sp. M2I2]|uniref:DEAD/DEAH box helicase n=1 Tax=Actinoplanes sp. M2I2 TaxID=1734444 RepID=UPI0020219CE3|nr:DEAD/DEAH box helicase [Actinoplanes sp. M2I2]
MLELRFSTAAGRIELSCDENHIRFLQRLRSKLPTASSISPTTVDVDIDDFLVNLAELAQWPDDDYENVHWQAELLALVEQNNADANIAASSLSDGDDATVSHPSTVAPLLGGGWIGNLNDRQRGHLAKLLNLSHGANFSVPGAGKTRVGLAVYQARRDQGLIQRMLVVCPKSAYESWYDETTACYSAGMAPKVAAMDSSAVPSADIVLINYERLPDARAALLAWLRAKPSMLILDEAHRMKLGAAGAWGAACLALGPYAAHRLILTGTPAPNGSRDLENLMSFVWPGQGRLAVSRAVAGDDLRAASQKLRPLFVRTTKAQLQLPPIDVKTVPVELPPLHRELYDALLGQMSRRVRAGADEIESLGRVTLYLLMAATTPALLAPGASRYDPLPYQVPPLAPPGDSSLVELMRDLPAYEMSPKYQAALKIVSDNAKRQRKTIVWSTFVRNLTSLEDLLKPFSPALIHGGTPDRAEQLGRFREDESCMVLLSNPATLGEGVSLHQVCHEAVYVDRDFAAGRFLQSQDRIHRLGLPSQTMTRIRILVANQTIDELVATRLSAKLNFMGGVLDDPEVLQLGELDEEPDSSVGMNSADIAALLTYLSDASA